MNPDSYAQFSPQARLSRALACILDVVTALVWPRRKARYTLTDCGRAAISTRYVEVSLDDWARLPICELCGKPSAMGQLHSRCMAYEAWQADDDSWRAAGKAAS